MTAMRTSATRGLVTRLASFASLTVILTFSIAAQQPTLVQAPASTASRVANDQSAQQTTPPNSKTASSLTDDLLDLLTEPSARPPMEKLDTTRPADVKLDGEDLGEMSADPLQAVRQNMLIVADFLERAQTDAHTQQLQSDIVKRLDELIDQLDQPPQFPSQSQASPQAPSQQTTENRDQQQQQSTSQSKQTQSPQSQSNGAEQSTKQRQPSGSDTGQFQQPSPRSTRVQLADPKALQQRAWGELPERTRQQMQSRMVEQFLPSYRDEIEAYYRALAK